MKLHISPRLHPWLLIGWIILLSFFFAEAEIQIEGAGGWAANLPTWRVEKHWLLDIFWGGRPMTGYHAWVFSFMALVFHLPVLIVGNWSLKHEARIIGCLMVFWIAEDFLWFILNPAYGLSSFHPGIVPWHKNWFFFVPYDYIAFSVCGVFLIWYSFRRKPG